MAGVERLRVEDDTAPALQLIRSVTSLFCNTAMAVAGDWSSCRVSFLEESFEKCIMGRDRSACRRLSEIDYHSFVVRINVEA
jgi:hypothetical protein